RQTEPPLNSDLRAPNEFTQKQRQQNLGPQTAFAVRAFQRDTLAQWKRNLLNFNFHREVRSA
ncbi:MAG: hypothetical protein NXI02_30295, partial [Rhodobacteraceae bacterium]|nr:hypothetical protein [Paracoccaceae bacterium]